MSTESVKKFLDKLQEDPSIEKGLAAAQAAAIVDYAARYGFDFTVEELAEITQKLLDAGETRQADTELTDDELENVAGGTIPISLRDRGYTGATAAAVVAVVTYGAQGGRGGQVSR